MASYKSFLRKASRDRLRVYITRRIPDFANDFGWSQKQSAFVEAIDKIITSCPLEQSDAIIGEIDRITELTDWAGQQAITEICKAKKIDLEACEGKYDRVLLLALDHHDEFQQAAMKASFRRRSGGTHWSNFVLEGKGEAGCLEDKASQESFVKTILGILEVHEDRRYDSDWYKAIRTDAKGERPTYEATIYVEQPREGELLFGENGIELKSIQRVGEIGICYDPSDRFLEVCAPGRKKQHDKFADAFIKKFIGESVEAVAVPSREIDFALLRKEQNFPTELIDRIERYEISELILSGPEGRKATFEQRNPKESVYDYLANEFGEHSPLQSFNWRLTGATIRVERKPVSGKGRNRNIVVDLKEPNRTNIRNRTDEDREFITVLFDRWKIFLSDNDEDILDREDNEMAV